MSLCPIIFKDEQSHSSDDRPGLVSYCTEKISLSFVFELFSRVGNFIQEHLSLVATVICRKTRDRVEMAQRLDLTPAQIKCFINDPSPLVRMELAWNRSISQEVLRKLIRDPDHTVSSVARRRLIKSTDEITIADLI